MTGGREESFVLRTEERGEIHLVSLRGELDVTVAGDLAEQLVAIACSTAVVDLSELRFIDAAGVSALLRAKDEIEGGGHRVVFRGATGLVLRVFDILGEAALLDPGGEDLPAP